MELSKEKLGIGFGAFVLISILGFVLFSGKKEPQPKRKKPEKPNFNRIKLSLFPFVSDELVAKNQALAKLNKTLQLEKEASLVQLKEVSTDPVGKGQVLEDW